VGVAGEENRNLLNVAGHLHVGFAPKNLCARNKAAARNTRFAPQAARETYAIERKRMNWSMTMSARVLSAGGTDTASAAAVLA
jgi:hypothetical protein